METVLRHIERRREVLGKHPFFEWVVSNETPLGDRLTFLPMLSNFSMGFRDVNKWVLRYPQAGNVLEEGINLHSFEDETHSRLFLDDWRRLGLDERLGWRASDTLWWLFLAEANEVARGHGIRFLSLAAADEGDPLLRFAHSEVIEACGAVFFGYVAPIASQLTGTTGIDYPYLGPYHLARETGHMDCEEVFESVLLDDRLRDRAMELADAMFDVFSEMFDTFMRFAQRYVVSGAVPLPAFTPPTEVASASGARYVVDTGGPIHPSQVPLQRLLGERKERTARHPFYLWLRDRLDLSPLQAMRRFIPLWAMDIMGYRDLNTYAMRYDRPANALEGAVNSWVDDLQTHSALFLSDWRELGLDQLLGWTASDTLEFCFLDPQMDIHRRNMAGFTHLAAAHTDPVLRLWLMHALESNGDAFFEHSTKVAGDIEADTGLRLDYLTGRHELAHMPKHPAEAQSTPVTFKDQPLDPQRCEIVSGMIEASFDAIDEHLTLALDVALSNKFRIP
ncbi:hypothetical protein KV205_31595 [Streptomyces sp. SKN60]|uniref:hypothetical protein n=1 Tax=Streptomyces sp. SKN60 TaxID=2855506 RepID=UPI002245E194|nr:hypothetical protein [Streptomyces sp. SKN60]MCX2185027.1 hypothetical protein [Streptomyces sp. SKN60]